MAARSANRTRRQKNNILSFRAESPTVQSLDYTFARARERAMFLASLRCRVFLGRDTSGLS
jgi:hypothetical protein